MSVAPSSGGVQRAACVDDLPQHLLLNILLKLPELVQRVRCGLVARRWAALLRAPSFWAELDFEGAKAERLGDDALLSVVRRSAGCLRLICVPFLYTGVFGKPWRVSLLAAMAAEGLTRQLHTLSWPALEIPGPRSARDLRAACPALRSASVLVSGPWFRAAAALSVLECTGPDTRAVFRLADEREDDFICFATAVADALSRSRVHSLRFAPLLEGSSCGVPGLNFVTLYDRAAASDPAATERAAAQLGAALASPLSGPRALQAGEAFAWCAPPVLAHACRALTPQAPLRELSIGGPELGCGAVLELAAAVAEGRARLEALSVWGSDLSAGGGCASMVAPPSLFSCSFVQ